MPSTTEDVNTFVRIQLVPTHVPAKMASSYMRTNMTAKKEAALITCLHPTEKYLVQIGQTLILLEKTVLGCSQLLLDIESSWSSSNLIWNLIKSVLMITLFSMMVRHSSRVLLEGFAEEKSLIHSLPHPIECI